MHYGQVLVCGNYEGHAQKIADTLNQWEIEGVTFEVEEDGRILPDEKWVVCPTAFPYRSWVIPEGGRRILASEFVFRVGEIYSLEYETIPLEDIARLIRPWLARGTIEIVAIGNGEDGLVYVEIHFDQQTLIEIVSCYFPNLQDIADQAQNEFIGIKRKSNGSFRELLQLN